MCTFVSRYFRLQPLLLFHLRKRGSLGEDTEVITSLSVVRYRGVALMSIQSRTNNYGKQSS